MKAELEVGSAHVANGQPSKSGPWSGFPARRHAQLGGVSRSARLRALGGGDMRANVMKSELGGARETC